MNFDNKGKVYVYQSILLRLTSIRYIVLLWDTPHSLKDIEIMQK